MSNPTSQTIHIQSPTRVDLAGGTLDLWPLYNFIDGAVTINTAINVFTEVTLQPLSTSEVIIESKDYQTIKKYSHLQALLQETDPLLSLIQAQVSLWKPHQGFHLTTSSQSPVGGGLGGSSSLTISMMKAFEQLTGRHLKSVADRVNIAHNLEASVLNTPTGTQDYYPADSGGLNILKYSMSGIEQQVHPIEGTPLDDHFMLVYTGRSHHSGMNNFEVMKAAVAKDAGTLKALKDLKVIALNMVEAVLAKSWNQVPELFRQEFEARVRLAPAFTCPEIEKLAEITIRAGAEAVKICGAGGGGCVLVWCAPQHQTAVKDVCQRNGFQVMTAKPVGPLKS